LATVKVNRITHIVEDVNDNHNAHTQVELEQKLALHLLPGLGASPAIIGVGCRLRFLEQGLLVLNSAGSFLEVGHDGWAGKSERRRNCEECAGILYVGIRTRIDEGRFRGPVRNPCGGFKVPTGSHGMRSPKAAG
jgi:hypothetical protein